jgi:acyl carrier protein
MANEAIYEKLTEVFQDIFLRDDLVLTPALSAKDVEGWDSFKMIEIIMATEEQFGVKLSTSEVDSLQSVGDLVTIIKAKTLT